jgi:hypothetical protein
MPFSEHRIKYLIREKSGRNLSEFGAKHGYRYQEVSMCIRQVPGRIYPALRILIAESIGSPVNTVFGRHSLTDALLKPKPERRKAA